MMTESGIMKCKHILLSTVILFSIGLCGGSSKSEARQHGPAIPMAARMVLAKAVEFINQKEYQKALDILTTFQARCPAEAKDSKSDTKGYSHPEVFFAIGTCHLMKGAYEEAALMYQKVLDKDPGHISAGLNLAKACYELGDYTKAAQCFLASYEHTETKNPEHLYNAAAAYLMAREYRKSIDVFDTLLTRHPADVRHAWRETYVHALISTGFSRRALPHIQKLAEEYEGEKKVQWQEILLHQYMQLDMNTEAYRYVLCLTREAPTRDKWWKALTHVHLQAGRYAPALTALTIYGFLAPLSDSEIKLMADLNLQLGIPLKAADLYETALAVRFDEKMLYNLMLALRELGQAEKALELCDHLAPKGNRADLLMLKADLLYSLEKYGDAEKTYVQATRGEAAQPRHCGRAWLMAGYAALQVNNLEASRRAFERAAGFKRQREAALLAIRQMSKTNHRGHKDL